MIMMIDAECNNSKIDFHDSYGSGGDEFSSRSLTKHEDESTFANNRNNNEEERRTLARKETNAISCLRFVVVTILFLTAVLVSLGVYLYTKNDEQQEFDQHVAVNSEKILETFHDSVERKLGSINTLATSITSLAMTTNATFPFVHVDHFPLRAADVRVLADAVVLHWLPLVTEENRGAWEKYAYKNRFQIDVAYEEEVQFRTQQDEFLGMSSLPNHKNDTNISGNGHNQRSLQESEDKKQPANTTSQQPQQQQQQQPAPNPNVLGDGTRYHMKIWSKKTNHAPVPEGTGPYLPLWQRSPVNAQKQAVQNLDFIGLKAALPVILNDQEVIIDKVIVPEGPVLEVFNKNLKISHERHNDPGQFISDPISFMAYPVFDTFGGSNRRVGGLLALNMYWRYYLKDILPPDAKGFYCVLANSFNETYTFRLDGPNVTYLGNEDLHDPDYNHYEVHANVNEYVRQRAAADTRAYTTVPLSTTFGIYTMTIFPSKDTEASIKTNKPVIYTTVIALVFVLTSLAFYLFNYFVERRQNMVMDRAVQSGAIVSSLFPKQVHERLYEESSSAVAAVEKKKQSWTISTHNSTSEWKVTNAPTVDDITAIHNDNANEIVSSSRSRSSKLIADSFPETTVMFGDLAGFTEWSSTRQPEEVFQLLETVYDQFDKIALRRKVFKVETIGDCYLAVAGLPQPQPDHAVIMVKFARDCLHKMEECVRNLSDTLGEDTIKLRLRVGLHSGPVTAGVLRGQKSRFQLFGDTVNTSARMESNGEPGKIHVSQETANELHAQGKSRWLVPREEKILAKGKGELQTYWVIVQGEKSVNNARSIRSAMSLSQGGSSSANVQDNVDRVPRSTAHSALSTSRDDCSENSFYDDDDNGHNENFLFSNEVIDEV